MIRPLRPTKQNHGPRFQSKQYLHNIPREAVQQPAILAGGLQGLEDHRDGHIVRDEVWGRAGPYSMRAEATSAVGCNGQPTLVNSDPLIISECKPY